MYCNQCGSSLPNGTAYCNRCGSSLGATPNSFAAPAPVKQGTVCPKCKSGNVIFQAITKTTTKHRGCFGWTLWILLAICTFGLILIIPLITNSKTKSKTHTEGICQNCGHRWKI